MPGPSWMMAGKEPPREWCCYGSGRMRHRGSKALVVVFKALPSWTREEGAITNAVELSVAACLHLGSWHASGNPEDRPWLLLNIVVESLTRRNDCCSFHCHCAVASVSVLPEEA